MFKKKQKDRLRFCDVKINEIFGENKTNRICFLLYRAVIMFMLVAGTIGCLLSSLSMPFDSFAFIFIIMMVSVCVSFFNYNKLCENIGYAVFMLIVIIVGYSLRTYIISGAHAIFNVFSDLASDYFSSNAMRNYGESVANREKAVTISMSYVGAIVCVLVNIYVLRKMLYLLSSIIIALIMFFPLYIEREPDFIYCVFMITSIIMIYIMNGMQKTDTRANNLLYSIEESKNVIRIRSKKAMFKSLGSVFLLVLIISGIFFTLIPKEEYNSTRTNSLLKENTMDSVENFTTMGLFSLFNYYPNKGGLTNGKLGGINTVVLDYNPDLKITFTPYSNDRLYLKNFIGNEYMPYENRWRNAYDMYDEAAVELENNYYNEDIENRTAQAKMKIENIDAPVLPYLPYHTNETDKTVYQGRSQIYTYYPKLAGSGLKLKISEIGPTYVEYSSGKLEKLTDYLRIPNDNIPAIEEFCENAGLFDSNSSDEVIEKTINYYQENIPYSYQPGATPWRMDFVNYFLTQNKKGYCAHFASAAVLIFRRMGIPARYVEGYAIDNMDIMQTGELAENENADDYYSGDMDISQTAVINVNATDANAHAWVEVYTLEEGWKPIEVTPASDKDYLQTEGLWGRFLRMLTSGGTNITENDNVQNEDSNKDYKEAGIFSAKIITAITAIAFIIAVFYILTVKAVQRKKYNGSTINDKLIIIYTNYISKKSKKYPELRNKNNYMEQIMYLFDKGIMKISNEEKERFYDILSRAGFSNKDIGTDEFEWSRNVMNKK